jgi:hypothetical protein
MVIGYFHSFIFFVDGLNKHVRRKIDNYSLWRSMHANFHYKSLIESATHIHHDLQCVKTKENLQTNASTYSNISIRIRTNITP